MLNVNLLLVGYKSLAINLQRQQLHVLENDYGVELLIRCIWQIVHRLTKELIKIIRAPDHTQVY